MRTFDGLQRRAQPARSRPEPLPPPPHPTRTSRSGNVLFGLMLLAGAFTLLRPPVSADRPATPVNSPSAAIDSAKPPATTFRPPQGGGEATPLEELLILDAPTETSEAQPDQNELTSEQEAVNSEAPISTQPATPALRPSDITVRILNGSGKAGAAAALRDRLTSDEFDVTAIGNAQRTYPQTTLYYQPGKQASAEAVATTLDDPAPELLEDTLAAPADVLVVIGTDR